MNAGSTLVLTRDSEAIGEIERETSGLLQREATVTTDKSRMLVVDDEEDMARGLRRLLKLKGYAVAIANSGEEAIELAREWKPNGILMDLRMPGIDGVEAYRQIRPLCPNAFVMFMTAFSSMVGEARDEGPLAVLTKPIDPEEMCNTIATALLTKPPTRWEDCG